MKTIDELTHDAAAEAEILRAVSHMAPSAAQEFLLNVAPKIRRNPHAGPILSKVLGATIVAHIPADTPLPPPEPVEAPEPITYIKPVDPGPTQAAMADLTKSFNGNRADEVIAYVTRHQPCAMIDIRNGCQKYDSSIERNRVNSTAYRLLGQGVLRKTDDGKIEMAPKAFPKIA